MRKLALFAAGFAAAAAWCVYRICDARAPWLAGFCLIFSPVFMAFGLKRCGILCLGLLAGFIWTFGYDLLWIAPANRACGTEQYVEVRVLENPSATNYGSYAAVAFSLEKRKYPCILYGGEDLLEAAPGDTVRCTAQIMSAVSNEKSGYFYHQANGTVLLLRTEEEVEIEAGEPAWYVKLRLWFQNQIRSHYDERVTPILLALLTGDQSELRYATRNELAITGLSHAMAVSGLHVSVLIVALALCFGYNPRLTAMLGIPLSVAFVLMTGASHSACRAAVMQIIMLSAPLVHREHDSWTSLSAAAVLLLLENPWAITGVGFQLSFAAVIGLLLFSSPLQQRMLGWKKKPGKLYRMAVSGIAACLSATVATLPLTVYYFGMVSVCAMVTNLLTLPAVNAALILGLGSCVPGFFGEILAMPVTVLVKYVLFVVETLAKGPFSAAYTENLPLMIWAAATYCLVVILLLWKKKISLWVPSAVIGTFLLCVLWGNWQLCHDTPIYRVLDVGQGQCIQLETGEITAVVDCGGSGGEAVGERAARILNSGGKTRADVLVVTHYDADHAGGVPQFLRRIKVDLVLLPDITDENGLREKIETAAKETGTRIILVKDITNVDFPGGSLKVYPSISGGNDDNAGICVLATAEEYDMLITGDLNQLEELRLVTRYGLPQVDFLVAGHHGSKESTGITLLKTVQPELVIVSAAADNPYGHPHEETVRRIQSAGAEIATTCGTGDIIIRRR